MKNHAIQVLNTCRFSDRMEIKMQNIKKLIKEVPSTVGTYITALPNVIKGRGLNSKTANWMKFSRLR